MSESCIKLHAVVVLELFLSEQCLLLVILCTTVYEKKRYPIMVKCLNIGTNIG